MPVVIWYKATVKYTRLTYCVDIQCFRQYFVQLSHALSNSQIIGTNNKNCTIFFWSSRHCLVLYRWLKQGKVEISL